MEMANLEFSQAPTQSKHYSRMNLPDEITLILSQQLADYTKQCLPQAKCIFCGQSHWSDECPSCKTLQER